MDRFEARSGSWKRRADDRAPGYAARDRWRDLSPPWCVGGRRPREGRHHLLASVALPEKKATAVGWAISSVRSGRSGQLLVVEREQDRDVPHLVDRAFPPPHGLRRSM